MKNKKALIFFAILPVSILSLSIPAKETLAAGANSSSDVNFAYDNSGVSAQSSSGIGTVYYDPSSLATVSFPRIITCGNSTYNFVSITTSSTSSTTFEGLTVYDVQGIYLCSISNTSVPSEIGAADYNSQMSYVSGSYSKTLSTTTDISVSAQAGMDLGVAKLGVEAYYNKHFGLGSGIATTITYDFSHTSVNTLAAHNYYGITRTDTYYFFLVFNYVASYSGNKFLWWNVNETLTYSGTLFSLLSICNTTLALEAI
jgi:hypothetical protein